MDEVKFWRRYDCSSSRLQLYLRYLSNKQGIKGHYRYLVDLDFDETDHATFGVWVYANGTAHMDLEHELPRLHK